MDIGARQPLPPMDTARDLLMMMSHLVHHRAQFGVYYRLLGVPVPGTYGSSAHD
jgi:uncharacterized damage-inducible protein DinB